MPTYFDIDFAIKYKNITDNFVANIYQSMFESEFTYYKLAFEEEKDLSLNDLIQWNQHKLEQKFVLGDNEHCVNDYKQIYLKNDHFSELRLFWKYDNEYCFLTLIVQDEELFVWRNERAYYLETNLNLLIELAENVFSNSNVEIVQSSWELDGYDSPSDIFLKQVEPVFHPFGIKKNDFKLKDSDFLKNYDIYKKITNGSIYIESNLNYIIH